MGTRSELESLMAMLVTTGVRPVIDTTMPLDRAADGFAKIVAGDTAGKIVLTV
jgi:D-arabinose 1-dehydrogenase-like Zn-dependent alcohol dehydrogenase